jgi:propionyl-CoA carboxylase beta chain
VIRTVTGEDVGMEELGGARTHNSRSGNAHYLAGDEDDAIDYVRALLSYLPSNNLDEPTTFDLRAELDPTTPTVRSDALIPGLGEPAVRHATPSSRRSSRTSSRCSRSYAQNIVVGFGRIEGRPVGAVANQPMHLAGTLDIAASERRAVRAHLRRRSTSRWSPFVDVPGFLPGTGPGVGRASSGAGPS